MSGGKFAKQQKRRRWCDQGLQVPASYKALLHAYSQDATPAEQQQLAASPQLLPGQPDQQLVKHLLHFVSIQFTYGEVEELKTTMAAADELAAAVNGSSSTWAASMQLLLELLFVQNSRPLHRQILAWLRKLPASHRDVAGQVIGNRMLKEALAVLEQQQQQQDDVYGTDSKHEGHQVLEQQQQIAAAQGLNLAQTAVSLLWLPASRPWMQSCSAALLLAIAHSVKDMLTAAQHGQHLTPNTMELIQDAISVMYYTLQHHGQHLSATAGQQGHAAIAAAAACMLAALQGTALVREAMASAAVVVWSAATLPQVPPAAAAAAFASGITPQQLQQAGLHPSLSQGSTSSTIAALQQAFASSSILEQTLSSSGSSLVNELQQLSPVGRVCALKGLLTAMPTAALAADLAAGSTTLAGLQQQQQQQQQAPEVSLQGVSSSNNVTFIMQCVLPFAVEASQSPTDSHFKFHAVSVVAIALQRAREIWQDLLQRQGLAAAAAAATVAEDGHHAQVDQQQQQHNDVKGELSIVDGRTSSSSSSCPEARSEVVVAPLLCDDGLLSVVELLWGNLDEPMAQTLAKVQAAFEALLELLVCQEAAAAQLGIKAPLCSSSSGSSSSRIGAFTDTSSFLAATAAAVLAVPSNKKGRYSPLTSLLGRVGAVYLLQQQQGLVQQVLGAMQDDMVANSASAFFKALLLQLRRETRPVAAAAAAGEADDSHQRSLQQQQQQEQRKNLMALVPDPELRQWCCWWLPELLGVLWGPNERFRTYVTNHALPVVLGAEPLLLRPMVDMIMAAHATQAGTEGSSKAVAAAAAGSAVGPVVNATAALVVVLKAARRLQLVGNLDTLLTVQEQQQLSSQYLSYTTNYLSSSSSSSASVQNSSRQQPAAANDDGVLAATAASGGSGRVDGLAFSPAGLLLCAVSSSSAALRLEALELACVNARSTDPPGVLELCIARRWLLLCLRCTGAGSRSKCLVLYDKLLTRQRAAAHAILHRAAVAKKPGATGGAHPGSLPKASANYLAPTAAAAAAGGGCVSDADVLLRQYDFIRWLSQTLLDSLYPGGPYERKYFALELLALLLQHWKPTSSSVTDYEAAAAAAAGTTATTDSSSSSSSGVAVHPLLRCVDVVPVCGGVLSWSSVQVLLGCLVDTWDKLRLAAARVLELLPSPLPGVCSADEVRGLLSWAVQLTHSPRVRESDAGARLLKILLIKYTLGLGWQLQIYPEPAATPPGSGSSSSSSSILDQGQLARDPVQQPQRSVSSGPECSAVEAIVKFLGNLTGQLRSQLLLAQGDLAAASRRGLVHGVVLTLRYLVEELPWTKITSSQCTVSTMVGAAAAAASEDGLQLQQQNGISTGSGGATAAAVAAANVVVVSGSVPVVVRAWLADLLALLLEVCRLVQPHLSSQDVNVAADEVEEDDEPVSDDDGDGDVGEDHDATQETHEHQQQQQQQQQQAETPGQAQQASSLGLSGPAIQLLTTACWTSVKEVFLLFGTLARRLPLPDDTSSSSSSSMSDSCSQLPAAAAAAAGGGAKSSSSSKSRSSSLLQVHQLSAMGDMQLSLLLSMKHNGAIEKSQAGYLWLCERLLQSSAAALHSCPAVWLNRCLERVTQQGQCRDDIVRRSAGLPFAVSCLFLAEPPGVPRQLLPAGLQQLLNIADDAAAAEPWPRVHAFNVLRCVFNDSAMALDSSGFHAAGVAAAIRGMAAEAWEVRNAAALTFTALIMRIIGYKNAGNKNANMKPLQQLAASPADLHAYCSATTAAALASAVSGSVMTDSSSSSSSPEGKRSWCQKSPTATEFFYRYPQLHSFLLQQLQTAADLQQQQQQCGDGSSSSRTCNEVPPSLFPVLVILSRLKPSLMLNNLRNISNSSNSSHSSPDDSVSGAGEDGAAGFVVAAAAAGGGGGALSPSALIPAVVAVGGSCVMGVRQIAALSLPPLVPADKLHDICQDLARLLPQQQQQQQQQGADCSTLSHNALHGTLLQLNALLSVVSNSSTDSGGSSSSSDTHVCSLVAALLPAFVSSSWIPGSSRCSSAVRQAYIMAAGQLLMLAFRNWSLLINSTDSSSSSSLVEQLQQLVADLNNSCQGVIQAAAITEASDPQHCCWLRDATAMLLGPLLRVQLLLNTTSTSNACIDVCSLVQQVLVLLEQRLLPCVATASYEVRASALKAAAVQLNHVLELEQQYPGLLMAAVAPDGPAAAAAALKQLTSSLWAQLEVEKTVKGLKRLLVVLGQLQRFQSAMQQQWQQQQQSSAAELHDTAVLQHLKAALTTAKQHKQVEVRIAALTCAAHKMRPVLAAAAGSQAVKFSSSSSTTPYIQECMQQLLQLIQTCSLYHQPEEVRAAAAQALQVSGFLWPLATPPSSTSSSADGSSTSIARLSVAAWSTTLRLMEDEEDMVRQPAADAAQQVLQGLQHRAAVQPDGRTAAGTHHQGIASSTDGTPGSVVAGSTGQYVEAVEQDTFVSLLGRCTAWWPEVLPDVLQLLTGIVFDSSAPVPEVLQHQRKRCETAAAGPAAASAVLAGVVVRRLFEKEADNHHEEPLLLAQHAAAALRQTLLTAASQPQQEEGLNASSSGRAAAAAAQQCIVGWCGSLRQYLGAVMGSLSGESSSGAPGGWVGGDTNHPEVFVPLYRCLLGLWAAAPWWTASTAQSHQQTDGSASQQPGEGNSSSNGHDLAAKLRAEVSEWAEQLIRLQPTGLLLPILRELQQCCGHELPATDAAQCSNIPSSGVLFLTQK